MDPPPALRQVVAQVHEALQAAGLPYAVVGRAAGAVWGSGQRPEQVDVVVKLEPGHADALIAGARSHGFETEAGLAELAAEHGDHLTLFPEEGPYVDVKPARGASDMAALRTAVERNVDGGEASLATLEETIARLLAEGTEEDVLAARRLLALHRAEVDPGYLGQRCEELGVAHLLREVQGEAPGPR